MECMVPTAIKARAIAPSLTPVARTDVEIGALPLDLVVAMALERVVDEEIAVGIGEGVLGGEPAAGNHA